MLYDFALLYHNKTLLEKGDKDCQDPLTFYQYSADVPLYIKFNGHCGRILTDFLALTDIVPGAYVLHQKSEGVVEKNCTGYIRFYDYFDDYIRLHNLSIAVRLCIIRFEENLWGGGL